jgi:carbamoyltransferase
MKILGIHDGHNASAALLLDGQPAAVLSEERLTYRKNEMGFPILAIKECLRLASVSPAEIDVVAFSSRSLPIHYLRIKREFAFTVRDWLDEQEQYWKPLIFEGRRNEAYLQSLLENPRFQESQTYSFEGVPYVLTPEENENHLTRIRLQTLEEHFGVSPDKVVRFDHHTCHAHYAYYGSPFRGARTLVVTADGGGDGTNATLSVAEGDELSELARNNETDLARIYRYITLLLGMKIGEHEYKVMGLAPYASEYEIRKTDKVFRDLFHVPDLMVQYRKRPDDLFFHFRDALADCRFDGIAGGVQQMVETVGAEWLAKATTRLGISRVVFSGGLSMNVKLNKRIAELPSVTEFYCPASGGDESLALGACYVAHRRLPGPPPRHIRDNFLGPAPDRSEILAAVSKIPGVTISEAVTARQVASLLAEGRVIARMAGRMEFGARSLGNRSILANPYLPDMVDRINQKIKKRDFWMPFAPSILDTYASRYLENSKNLLSDHMTHTFDCTSEGRKVLVAALHPADKTVRAHIVSRAINPGYYELLEHFADLTGVGAVLNTSFNLHGYPVVCFPEQAVHVFENSALDGMILEDVLILREYGGGLEYA